MRTKTLKCLTNLRDTICQFPSIFGTDQRHSSPIARVRSRRPAMQKLLPFIKLVSQSSQLQALQSLTWLTRSSLAVRIRCHPVHAPTGQEQGTYASISLQSSLTVKTGNGKTYRSSTQSHHS